MRTMNSFEKNKIEREVKRILQSSVSDAYSDFILEAYDSETAQTFLESVVQDIIETSACNEEGCYNDSSIRYAIGREFMARMGLVY